MGSLTCNRSRRLKGGLYKLHPVILVPSYLLYKGNYYIYLLIPFLVHVNEPGTETQGHSQLSQNFGIEASHPYIDKCTPLSSVLQSIQSTYVLSR